MLQNAKAMTRGKFMLLPLLRRTSSPLLRPFANIMLETGLIYVCGLLDCGEVGKIVTNHRTFILFCFSREDMYHIAIVAGGEANEHG